MFLPRSVLAATTAFAVHSASVPVAHAEPASEVSASAAPPAVEPSAPRRSGFEFLASAGYGASTGTIAGVELAPYAASVGLDVGYVFRFGFRVGVSVGYGFGRTVTQRREPILAEPYDFDIDTSSMNLMTSLGYDVPLYSFVLRYTLGLGVTFMPWELNGALPDAVFEEIPSQSPSTGFLAAPGVTLLWPHGAFECGVGFDYFVQANGVIPPGFLGKLVIGVKP